MNNLLAVDQSLINTNPGTLCCFYLSKLLFGGFFQVILYTETNDLYILTLLLKLLDTTLDLTIFLLSSRTMLVAVSKLQSVKVLNRPNDQRPEIPKLEMHFYPKNALRLD